MLPFYGWFWKWGAGKMRAESNVKGLESLGNYEFFKVWTILNE